jgi:hypothetical protein
MKYPLLLASIFVASAPQNVFAQSSKKLDELMAKADKIAQEVASGRGLPLKNEIVKKTISQDEVRKKLVEEFDKEFKPGEIESEALTYQKLGLMSPTDDYRKILLDVLTEQIAGFYDTDAKELFLVQEIAPDRGALAHEICHALQDQHFDLNVIQDKLEADHGLDASLAFAALVEGDAMAAMLEDQLGWRGMFANIPNLPEQMKKQMSEPDERSAVLDSAPRVIKESLIFPYLDGLAFVYALRQTGTWSVIDAAFADPPVSSEQILHPQKYLKRDMPTKIEKFVLANLSTHQSMYDATFGEFQFGVWFRQALSEEEAKKAAAGWDGDIFMTFAPKALTADKLTAKDLDSLIVAAVSIWDTEADAKEAAAAFRKVSLKLLPGAKALTSGAIGDASKAWSSHALVVQEKNKVIFAIGMSGLYVDSMREDLQKIAAGVVLIE